MTTIETTAPLSVRQAMHVVVATATPEQALSYARTLDEAREQAKHDTMQAGDRWGNLTEAAEAAWDACESLGYPRGSGSTAEGQALTLEDAQHQARAATPLSIEAERWKALSRKNESYLRGAQADADAWKRRAKYNAAVVNELRKQNADLLNRLSAKEAN